MLEGLEKVGNFDHASAVLLHGFISADIGLSSLCWLLAALWHAFQCNVFQQQRSTDRGWELCHPTKQESHRNLHSRDSEPMGYQWKHTTEYIWYVLEC